MFPSTIEHKFTIAAPLLYPNREIFLAVATFDLDRSRVAWGVPEQLLPTFGALSSQLNADNLDDPRTAERLAASVDYAMGFSEATVRWRRAWEYNYWPASITNDEHGGAIFNRDPGVVDAFPVSSMLDDAYLRAFLSEPFCCAICVSAEIAAVCFHGGNGAVTSQTKEQFRNKGFGTSCLRLLTRRSVDAGIRPTIATEADNHPMVRLAAKAGYSLAAGLYWITLPPTACLEKPEWLQSSLAQARFG